MQDERGNDPRRLSPPRPRRLTVADLQAARSVLDGIAVESHVPAGMRTVPVPPAVRPAGQLRTGSGAQLTAAAAATATPGDPALFDVWPWSTVGKVVFGHYESGIRHTDGHGSGVLVGRRVMLTAGHVVPWEYMDAGTWWMRFYPAFYNGMSSLFGVSEIDGWYGIEDTTPFDDDVSDIAGRDYAVCSLVKPLGDICGFVGATHLEESRYDDFVYTSIGYPGNVQNGDVPCIETGLTIRDIDNAGEGLELETRRYPAAGGWSGGPLWAQIDGGIRVVGVATSPQKDFGFDPVRVMHSGGGLMMDIIRYGLANFVDPPRFDWSGWFPFGGSFHAGDSLTAVERGPGTHEVFGRGVDNRIWQNDYPVDNDWSGWNLSVPGALAVGPPTALSWSPDHVNVFWIGTDGQAWTSNWYDSNGAWQGPYPIGGGFQAGDSLAVVAARPNTFQLFGRGTDNRIWQNDYEVGVHDWTGWNVSVTGTVAAGPPTALSWSPDHVSVFWIGTDGQAWTSNWYDSDGAWQGPYPIGGGFQAGDSLAVVAARPNTFQLFGRGTDNRIWQNDYEVGVHDWTGWRVTALGATISGSPAALSHHAEHVQLYAIDDNLVASNTYWGNLG
jgi:V8-like Glu-specific endopeptidase